MAGKISKASTPRPDSAGLKNPKHEAFVQAYITNGFNATKAYRTVYPKTKSDRIAQACSSRLLSNAMVGARVAEIMAVGAERAEVKAEDVIRELKAIGFSSIGDAVDWHNEAVTLGEEGEEDEGKTVVEDDLNPAESSQVRLE